MVKVKKDLTGMSFGRLTVIEQAEDHVKPDGEHAAQWICKCSCNNTKLITVRGDSLTTGHTQSCGCLQSENAKKVGKENQKTNKFDLTGEYGILWSNNTNEEVYFDLINADKILQYNWNINEQGYAWASINRQKVLMHKFLGYKWHDHHNRNKLDNRKENLVPCTIQENARNGSIRVNNTSGFIGVSIRKDTGKWYAGITIDGHRIHLGYFINKEDAIKARLEAEAKYFKDFAPQRHLFEEYGIEYIQEED